MTHGDIIAWLLTVVLFLISLYSTSSPPAPGEQGLQLSIPLLSLEAPSSKQLHIFKGRHDLALKVPAQPLAQSSLILDWSP